MCPSRDDRGGFFVAPLAASSRGRPHEPGHCDSLGTASQWRRSRRAPVDPSKRYDHIFRSVVVVEFKIIDGEPDFYHMYSEKTLSWNGITQNNRNGLLWDNSLHVDGLKTGHTETAGFNIIASNVVGNHRLIAVIMGGKSSKGREEQARKLLVWGQNNFDTVQLFHAGRPLGNENVWYGSPHTVAVGSDKDLYLSLPKNEINNVKAKYVIDKKELEAPLQQNQQIGEIKVMDKDQELATYPLVALQKVDEAGIFTRAIDYLKRKL